MLFPEQEKLVSKHSHFPLPVFFSRLLDSFPWGAKIIKFQSFSLSSKEHRLLSRKQVSDPRHSGFLRSPPIPIPASARLLLASAGHRPPPTATQESPESRSSPLL